MGNRAAGLTYCECAADYVQVPVVGTRSAGADFCICTAAPRQTLVQTELTSDTSTVDGLGFVTAVILPVANRPVIFDLHHRGPSPITSIEGCNLAWSEVATVVFSSGARHLSRWMGIGASPTEEELTVIVGAEGFYFNWYVHQWAGAHLTNTCRQSKGIEAVGEPAPQTVTLDSPLDHANNVMLVTVGLTSAGAVDSDAGFTETHEVGPEGKLEAQHAAGQTACTVSWPSTPGWAILATELRAGLA